MDSETRLFEHFFKHQTFQRVAIRRKFLLSVFLAQIDFRDRDRLANPSYQIILLNRWTRPSGMRPPMLDEAIRDEAANDGRGRQCWTRPPMLDEAPG